MYGVGGTEACDSTTGIMRITVGNLQTRIEPAYQPNLENFFKVRIPRWWFHPRVRSRQWDGCYRFYSSLSGRMPTGLLDTLLGYLDTQKVAYTLVDQRGIPPVLDFEQKLHGVELRADQVGAVAQILGGRLRQCDWWWPRGVVRYPTGAGKTVMIAAVCQFLRGPGLIVIDKRTLLHQTARVLEQLLQEPVGRIGDGELTLGRITVSTVQTVSRRLPGLQDFLARQQLFISDEGHHLPAATFTKVAMACPAFARYAFSATPFVEDDLVQRTRLVGTTGRLLVSMSGHNLPSVVAPVEYRMVTITEPAYADVPLSPGAAQTMSCPLKDMGYADAYTYGIVQNTHRNDEIVRAAQAAKPPTLIIVSRLEHGRLLAKALGCPFIRGEQSTPERHQALTGLGNGDIPILVSSPILDEGVDVPAIRTMILAAGGKSGNKFIQRVGRGRRRKEDGGHLDVIDFVDATHRQLLAHSKQRHRTAVREHFKITLDADVGRFLPTTKVA